MDGRVKRKFKGHFVDLFAGCGGLSLGLENAGFCPVFVSEINPDAMRTYLDNRVSTHDHLQREEFHCYNIKSDFVLKPQAQSRLASGIESEFNVNIKRGELDLVVGGPPCQGFSGIGHRRSYAVDRKQLPSNLLYEDMIFVISKLRPKIFLFENVRGLLSAPWTRGGTKGGIWRTIQNTFKEQLGERYKIHSTVVYAKHYGVPQNRPRVMMIGVHKDFASRLDSDAYEGGFLPEPFESWSTVQDVLGDLVDPAFEDGDLPVTRTYPLPAEGIQRYFRKDPETGKIYPKGALVDDHAYSRHSVPVTERFQYMLDHNGAKPKGYQTMKFAQRLLPRTWPDDKVGPTITATSMPDDYVHFSQPRTLTVREWARLQTFPDWYVFRGKRTTGGIRRAGNPRQGNFHRELPKYTQIGNAVPVRLAEAIGTHFEKILR